MANLGDNVKNAAKKVAKQAVEKMKQAIIKAITPAIPYIALGAFLFFIIITIIGYFIDIEPGEETTNGVSEPTGWWWPIGSAETTSEGGILFASGDPELGKDMVSRAGSNNNNPKYTGWGGETHHYGNKGGAVDIAGSPSGKYHVISIADGTVTQTGSGIAEGADGHDGMGNHVIVDYGGITVRYMHLYDGSITVKQGDTVTYGQVLGKTGHNGNSTGTHLHIDMYKDGDYLDATHYLDPDNPRPMEFTSYGVLSGSSALGEFLKEWENASMRGYINGTIKDYNSTEYIYRCITKDKKYYIMHDDLGTGYGNRNYGFGICFYVGRYNSFQNTSYFKEEGIDVTQSKYNVYGESKIAVEIVDRIKEKIIDSCRNSAKSIAKNVGVELKEYQIDAIAACIYQGWESTPEFLTAYKKYGMVESIRSQCTGMGTSNDRYKANWTLFSTGKYIGKDGKEIKMPSTGTIKDEKGAGYTKTITIGQRKYKVYNQCAYQPQILSSGCSISCEAIVLSAYGGTKSPEGVANYVKWAFPRSLEQIANDLTNNGVKSTASVKFSQQNNSSTHNTAIKEIKNNLSQGRPVIILVRRGPDNRYTSGAHYIVLVGFDKSGKPIVADPNGGRARTESTLEEIVKNYIYYTSDYEQGYVLINQ